MLTCSKRSLLLVLVVAVIALQLPFADADATATIEVDGANVTLDNTVCPNAAWRVGQRRFCSTPGSCSVLYTAFCVMLHTCIPSCTG